MATNILLRVLHSTLKFLHLHETCSDQLRLGQRFVIMYIRSPWPELFYSGGEAKAIPMINRWLEDNQYINDLPQVIERN